MKTFLCAVLVLFGITTQACAGTVTLAWDTYTDVADGFYCYASSTSPVNPIAANRIGTVTTTTTTTLTATGVQNGTKYFVCTAFAGALESVPSNEVSGVVRPNKPLNLRIP